MELKVERCGENMDRWENEEDARNEIKLLVKEFYKDFKVPNTSHSFKQGDRIAYAGRVFDEEEMMYLTDAMLDFWLTSGRFSEQFETKFSEWLGIRYAHLVNSGSSANLLAFAILTSPELGGRQIKAGDEVITVACGFPTTVTPIIQYGAIPVFVDVSIPEYNIDISRLKKALSKKTKAVMIAHTLGNPFNLREVKKFCDSNNLWLIEDNCDALGSRYIMESGEKYTGTIGDIGTSSFYPPHHMTMGEGGCVYTNSPVLHKLLLSYRDWGRDCICPPGHDGICNHRFDRQIGELPFGYDHKYIYSHFGYNLKLTDLQAAIGLAQLDKLDSFIEARRRNWKRIYDNLNSANLSEYIILPEPSPFSTPSWFGFIMTVKDGSRLSRDRITNYLEKRNIQTRLLFSGNLLRHPCFDEIRGTRKYRVVGSLEKTDYVMSNSFWVGVYPGLTAEMIDYMSDSIVEAVKASLL